jgi:hypothetical protein
MSHLGRDNIKKPSDVFEIGDELPLKVIRIDPDARKILLSVKDYLADQDREEVEEYMQKYGPRTMTVGEVVAAKEPDEPLPQAGGPDKAPEAGEAGEAGEAQAEDESRREDSAAEASPEQTDDQERAEASGFGEGVSGEIPADGGETSGPGEDTEPHA